jgi:hypothetical protein
MADQSVPAAQASPDIWEPDSEFKSSLSQAVMIVLYPEVDENPKKITYGHACLSLDLEGKLRPMHPVCWTFGAPRVRMISIQMPQDYTKPQWEVSYAQIQRLADWPDKLGPCVVRLYNEADSQVHVYDKVGRHGSVGDSWDSPSMREELLEQRTRALQKELEEGEEDDEEKRLWLEVTLHELSQANGSSGDLIGCE